MQRSDLELLLKQKVHVVEGSLGSELARRRGSSDVLLPRVVLESPDIIANLHRDFGEVGATLHIAATSEANRLALRRSSLPLILKPSIKTL